MRKILAILATIAILAVNTIPHASAGLTFLIQNDIAEIPNDASVGGDLTATGAVDAQGGISNSTGPLVLNDEVEIDGPLTFATDPTVTAGADTDITFNVSGTGSVNVDIADTGAFNVQDNGTNAFTVDGDGNTTAEGAFYAKGDSTFGTDDGNEIAFISPAAFNDDIGVSNGTVTVTNDAVIGSINFFGAGPNDMDVTGPYTGTLAGSCMVQITYEGTPDLFQWTCPGGNGVDVAITGSNYLIDGIAVSFGATTGHVMNDMWNYSVTPEAATSIIGGTINTLAVNIGTGTLSLTDNGLTDGNGPLSLMAQSSINLNSGSGAGVNLTPGAGAGVNVSLPGGAGQFVVSNGLTALSRNDGHAILSLDQTDATSTYNVDINLNDNGATRWVQSVRTAGGSDDLWFYNIGRTATDLAIENSTGEVGIGEVSPDAKLHVTQVDSGTGNVTYNQRLTHETSSTATSNFGVGAEYEAENAAGANMTLGQTGFRWINAGTGLNDEDAEFFINNQYVPGGGMGNTLTLSGAGNMTVAGDVATGGNLATGNALYVPEISAPSQPSSGIGVMYEKNDGKLYFKNDLGTEYDLTGGGTPDAIWDADTDTGIQVEEGADDDTFRVDLAATEVLNMNNTTGATFNDGGSASFDVRIEGDTDANLFFLDASTDMVGIGTNTPGSALHVQKSSGSTRLLGVNQTAGSISADVATIGGYAGSGYKLLNVEDSNGGTLGSGTTRFVVEAGGKVGIGTPTPNNTFQVANYINFEGNDATAIGYQALNTATGTNNTAVGYQTLYSQSGSGENNTALGYRAGYNNASIYNTYLGSQAGENGTNGGSNVGVGFYAMRGGTDTGHHNNNAIGQSSMYSITGGDYNNAMGKEAMFYLTTGSNNVAIGETAGFNNTTGSNNVVMGYQAQYGTASDAVSGVTAIGYGALKGNQTDNNTAIGNNSGYTNSAGEYLTFIGNSAGYSNTTASSNTAVGDSALYFNQTGINNTALGENALRGSTGNSHDYNTGIGKNALLAITTGDNNVAVGYGAADANQSGSNMVAIGYNAAGVSTNRTGVTAVGAYAAQANTAPETTAIGYYALSGQTSGSNNVGVGYQALNLNATGGNNTAIGYAAAGGNAADTAYNYTSALGWAALASVQGDYNTGLGASAGYSVSTGTENTLVGAYAGTTLTTGSQNTIIGRGANVSANNLANSIAIGYNASVNASNKAVIGNSSVTTVGGYGNWSNYSDKVLKENIEDNNDFGIDFINKLNVRNYNLIDQPGNKTEGFIAQEVEDAMNDLNIDFHGITPPQNQDDYYMLSYSSFVMPLTAAVQELDKKFGETVYIDENGNANLGMTTPVSVSARSIDTGSLSAGTYYYKVTASNGTSETLSSEETFTTIDGIDTRGAVISWAAVPGATSYRVYKGTSSNGQNTYFTTTGTTYTDSGASGTAGTIPTTSTGYINRFSINGDSWVTSGNFGVGTRTPDAPLAVAGDIKSYGNTFYLDSDNSGAGANVDIVAAQGSDNAGKIRYDATDNQWKISNDGGSFTAIPVAQVFDGYDSAGDTSVTTTESVLNIDTTNVADSTYTLSSDAVTINKDGLYKLAGRITVDSLDQSGAAQSSVILRAEKDTGSGFTDIVGALCQDSIEESNNAGKNSASCAFGIFQNLLNGNIVRLTHQMSGTTTAQTVPQGSGLTIELVR